MSLLVFIVAALAVLGAIGAVLLYGMGKRGIRRAAQYAEQQPYGPPPGQYGPQPGPYGPPPGQQGAPTEPYGVPAGQYGLPQPHSGQGDLWQTQEHGWPNPEDEPPH